jgi:hypothetical protein
MPLYRGVAALKLDDKVAELEGRGELILQVTSMRGSEEKYLIVTRIPRNETGNAWLPSSAKETR